MIPHSFANLYCQRSKIASLFLYDHFASLSQLNLNHIYNQLMLTLIEEKHLACFDLDHNYYASYLFTLIKDQEPEEKEKNGN